MARIFLLIYVAINIFVLIVNAVSNIFRGETTQVLDKDDWLIFIIACGALGICEAIENKN